MNILYCSISILSLSTAFTYAGSFFTCMCGGDTAVEEIVTTKIHVVEAPRPTHQAHLPSVMQTSEPQTLQVPQPIVRSRSTTTTSEHVRSTVVAALPVCVYPDLQDSASSAGLASSRGSASIVSSNPTPTSPTPKTVLLVPPSPQAKSQPSTPLTPISPGSPGLTPPSDSSPSSPGSPLMSEDESPESPTFEPGHIITYPAKIREKYGYDRYVHATALVEAFKKDFLIINDKQQKIWRLNADIDDARTDFATKLAEYCGTHQCDDFPCIIDYRDSYTGKPKSVTMNEGQYADLRALGIESYGRSLTKREIAYIFTIVGIPEELTFQEFYHELAYEVSINTITKKYWLMLKQERLKQIQQLISEALPLSADTADKIIQAISVKLDSKGRSLRQSMLTKATPEAREKFEQTEGHDMLSLTESTQILDPRFTALTIPKHHQSLH